MRFTATGFTLVELLVSIALIAILTGMLIPSFSTYTKNQNLRQAQEQVKSDLRTIQNRALTGVASTAGITHWGVRFVDESDTYTFFTTDDITASGCVVGAEASTKLPGNALIKNGDLCVFFSLDNGSAVFHPSTLDIIKIGYSDSDDGECVSVEVNSQGLIRADTDTSCT